MQQRWGWILKRGAAFSFMGGPWRPAVKEGLLPSGVQQMLRLLINPFSLAGWNLATHRYGNSSVRGWRGMTDAARRSESSSDQSREKEREWLQLRSFYFFLSDKPRDDVISHTALGFISSAECSGNGFQLVSARHYISNVQTFNNLEATHTHTEC